MSLTYERLREVLDYDPETGICTWLIRPCRNRAAGTRAGTENQGYRNLQIDRHLYREHMLVWFYMTGAWPSHLIDHIDVCGTNNVWLNLRSATVKQNAENVSGVRASSGHRGIHKPKGQDRWHARIGHNFKTIWLGSYDNLADAVHVRQAAERLLYTHSKACRSPS